MKETALQYTTFGYAQLHHTDIIKVKLVPHSYEAVVRILDCEIEHYEINIEDGAGTDTLDELSTLKGAQYKLMRGHKFDHATEFTRVELVAMDDVLTQWMEMNENEGNEDKPSDEAYYTIIALNKITKALQHMG